MAALALVVWYAGPVLRHFEGALIPWPTHGVAIAILIGARAPRRPLVGASMLLAITVGVLLGGGALPRALATAAQVTGQSVLVALLFERLARGQHPLSDSVSYAWFLFAIVVATIPTTLLVALVLAVVPGLAVPGYTSLAWWVAAAASGAALAPVLLAPSRPAPPGRRHLLSIEFLAICAFYAVALLNAFLHVGIDLFALPPAVATLPFLAWASLRFGVRGFSVVAAMLISAVIGSTLVEVGPFLVFDADDFQRGQRAWVYLASIVGPAMFFPVGLAERAAAEERARGAHAQLAAILEGSGDLIAAVDRNLVVIAANPAWVQGFEQLTGVVVSAGDRIDEVVQRALPSDAVESIGYWRRALSGERFTVVRELGELSRGREEYEITYSPVRDARGELVGASQVVRNVTTRRRREAEDGETRRLESVGRLAGGVAHDFNNLMTAVIGYTELIAATIPPGDPRRDDLAQIERAAVRAGELTQQLLAFARRRFVEPKIVDLGELVEGFTRLLAPLLGKSVLLTVHTEPGLRRVTIDPTQFEQVLMNLAVNSRDAMPGGGRLEIRTSNAVIGARLGVRLSVRDSGVGMTGETLARVWEPFFTTKPLGQGTGLGLPTVHGIVHQAGGEITVESKPGAGSAFHVFFPESGEAGDSA
jgi:signal transduction histidine kinase